LFLTTPDPSSAS